MANEEIPETFPERVRRRIEKLGSNALAVSRAVGRSESFVKNIYAERSKYPRADAMDKLAEVLGTTPSWLLHGEGPEEAPQPQGSFLQLDTKRTRRPMNQPVTVAEIDTRAGAGGPGMVEPENVTTESGIIVSQDVIRHEWGIPGAVLRQFGMRENRAVIIEVLGDSGYDPSNPAAPGSIHPGDRIIVDLDDTRPTPPGPFLVHDGIGLVVKLVEPVRHSEPPRITLSSRNPRYKSEDVTSEESRIIGRVRGKISAA